MSFEIPDGQCLAITGPSGSGKTRLLRAIADLDEAPGQIFIDGAERNEMSAPNWRALIRYNAAEPGWWSETPRSSFPTHANQATQHTKLLASLNLGEELLDRPISQLSTGERQRLALARSFLGNPRVLALDEPTAALDKTNAALVEELIRYQLLSGKIVLLVSHDPAQIDRLCNAILQLAPTNTPDASGKDNAGGIQVASADPENDGGNL